MNYPLEQILRIRSLREQTALVRTQEAQQKVKEAEKHLHSSEKKLVECRNALYRQEEMLFKSVIKRKITLFELETLQGKLHGMKSIEIRCLNDVNDAADNVKDTQKVAERKKLEFYKAAKQKKKLEEHYQIWQELEKHILEKALEEDLDELALQRRF